MTKEHQKQEEDWKRFACAAIAGLTTIDPMSVEETADWASDLANLMMKNLHFEREAIAEGCYDDYED